MLLNDVFQPFLSLFAFVYSCLHFAYLLFAFNMTGSASGGSSIIFFNYFSLCLLLGLCLPLFTSMYTLFTYCLLSLWLTVPLYSFQRRISTTFIFFCLPLFTSLQLFTIVYTLIIYCLLSIYLAVLQLAFFYYLHLLFPFVCLPAVVIYCLLLFTPCLSIVESRWLAQSFSLRFNDLLLLLTVVYTLSFLNSLYG